MLFPLLVSSLVGIASAGCSGYSTAHAPPVYDLNDAAFRHALAEINTAFVTTVAAPEFAATSFSAEITSSKKSLWSKHQTARDRNVSRPDVSEVNGNALYRIASITKTFTVLGILYQHKAGNLSLDDSVIQYIEELREEQEGSIPWKDITLRSLASQLSGIPRECILPDPRFCHTAGGMQTDFLLQSLRWTSSMPTNGTCPSQSAMDCRLCLATD
jgi:CubicO group peptidase (beta-lactamase class C family)